MASRESASSESKYFPPGGMTADEYRQRESKMASRESTSSESKYFPPGGMTADEYRQRGKQMVDYIAEYLETIRTRRVFPDVQPGYMQSLLPDSAPTQPDSWDKIMADVENVVMPGVTHWQSPYMHAYFPALNSYPSLLGDMLADAINCLGFTWASSPACTELETIVMDWLGKMLGLPASFLHANGGTGGGCIQTTASECTFVTLLAARTEAIRRYKLVDPNIDDADINGRLIGYCSDQAHSSVEKAGLIGLVKLRFLASDDKLSLKGAPLQEAITADRKSGYIPFFVCATLGTTGACAFDSLTEIGQICESERLWLHVDAAYAGSAFICPEYRKWMAGIEYADSLAFNPSKWLMVHFDCSALWLKDARALHRTFNVEPLYLQHENSGAAIDYMHWQIALSRRFRSLKLWFVLRTFGVEQLQKHIRKGVALAAMFEGLVQADPRFEVAAPRHLGMVVFRMMGTNDLTEQLLKRLNKQGKVHMVPASLKGKYVIRFTVTSQFTTEADIRRDWSVITDMARVILCQPDSLLTEKTVITEALEENEEDEDNDDRVKIQADSGKTNQQDVKQQQASNEKRVSNPIPISKKRPTLHIAPKGSGSPKYGISLLLSNVPMSPKIVNGSFAAMFDDDVCREFGEVTQHLSVGGEFIRLSPRRRGRLGQQSKQMSLDYSVLEQQRGEPRGLQRTMVAMGSLDSKIDDILEMGSAAASVKKETENDVGDKEDSVESQEANGGAKVKCVTSKGHLGEKVKSHGLEFSGDEKKDYVRCDEGSSSEVDDGRVVDKENWDTGTAAQKISSSPASRMIDFSKSVASKVKGVLMTFPSGSPPTTSANMQTQMKNTDAHGNTNKNATYCKHCGHVLE